MVLGCFVVVCLFALFWCCQRKFCIQLAFHIFCGFPVVDRPCPVLARLCRKKKAWRSDSVESAKSSQTKRSPARQWQQRNSRSGTLLVAAKVPTQGQYRKTHKTNDKGYICERQKGETCWTGGNSGNVNVRAG